jgi:hypothetical protein
MSIPNKKGRPKFVPTDKDRLTVSIMVGACGMPHEYVCTQIINPQTRKPIDKRTLRSAFREELGDGKKLANSIVAQALFKKATGVGPQSVTAAIFWLKCQAGWKPVESVELTGKDGTPLPGAPQLTPEQFERVARKLAEEV